MSIKKIDPPKRKPLDIISRCSCSWDFRGGIKIKPKKKDCIVAWNDVESTAECIIKEWYQDDYDPSKDGWSIKRFDINDITAIHFDIMPGDVIVAQITRSNGETISCHIENFELKLQSLPYMDEVWKEYVNGKDKNGFRVYTEDLTKKK
ncbi:MAG: hypothetical protein WC119_01690 [Synergistaceae bacterium]